MYKIAIIDDKFPYDINKDAVNKFFPSTKIEEWLANGDWSEEGDLKKLLDRIVASDLYNHKEIELICFLFPSALLNYLSETKEYPQLIIFDWEYQTQNQDTKKHLIEIINQTTSHIFIYTAQANSIWTFLVGEVFEKNLSRLQLLLKGDNKVSLFSSEDQILQFIISQFKEAYEFKMGEHSIRFEENKFLKSPSDILLLETMLGKNFLLDKLKKANFEISDNTIENIFSDVKLKFYLSKDKKYLLETKTVNSEKKYGALEEFSFLNALSKFGVKKIDKTLERGIAQV